MLDLIITTLKYTVELILKDSIDVNNGDNGNRANKILTFFVLGYGLGSFFFYVTGAYVSGSNIANGIVPHSLDEIDAFHKYNGDSSIDEILTSLNRLIVDGYQVHFSWRDLNSGPIKVSFNYNNILVEKIDEQYRTYLAKPTEIDPTIKAKSLTKQDFIRYIFVGTCITLYVISFIWADYPCE